jgi:chemotaxis protein MotB
MTPFPQHGSRTGADRWMVSYADLVTLLFAFFTTLYASSTIDSAKMAPVASSIQEAFAPTASNTAGTTADVTLAASAQPPADDLQNRLRRLLGTALAEGRIELIRDPRGLVLSLPDDATFAVGSADATIEARSLIDTVGGAIRSANNAIRIEGHTDNVPIKTTKYDSNWELSTARAAAVVIYLVNTVGIDAARLSAAGYGEFHPRGPNTTAEGRARNRRVDLVILDAPGTALAPDAGGDAHAEAWTSGGEVAQE